MIKRIAVITLGILMSSSGFSQIKFESSTFDEALAKAKKENKKLFVDVYTTWCGPCKRMDKYVFSDVEVGKRIAKNYVALKVDFEKSPDKAKVSPYGIKGYPTMLILDGEGKEIGRIYGSRSLDGFNKELDTFLPEDQQPKNVALKAMTDNPQDKTIWRENMTYLNKNGHYQEFKKASEDYVAQFGLDAIKDDLDQQIFYNVQLPLDNPIVQELLNDKKEYGSYRHQDYKILELKDKASKAKNDEELAAIKKELDTYYNDIFKMLGGDVASKDYYYEQVFPQVTPEAEESVEEGDDETNSKAEDTNTKKKKKRKKKRK